MKKRYEKPIIKLVLVEHESSLATGSQVTCEVSDITHEWEDEGTQTQIVNWNNL